MHQVVGRKLRIELVCVAVIRTDGFRAVATGIAFEHQPDRFRVGTEHEKIGLRQEDLGSVPYEGERGIGAVLEKVAREDEWARVFEAENLIALEKDGASITLEPGGQLELSGAPVRTIFETCQEFNRHLDLIRRVSEPMGLVWLSLGCNPLHEVAKSPACQRPATAS